MSIQRTFHNCIVFILFGIALSLPAKRTAAETPPAPPPVDHVLLEQLRQGGFVIFFRHAPTELSNIPDSAENIAQCETQRNLSATGRKTAKAIGEAFKKLHIPVGVVKTSPFCRCKDTARLAFGTYTVDRNLYFSLNIDAGARKQLTEETRKMLATPPADSTNTVIVSHTANLREATGYWPKPEGTAYIFRPGPDGTFTAEARMAPDDWQLLSSTQASP
jgi:broad specificity phosphatase PhoE